MKKSILVFLVLFSLVSLQIFGQTWSSLKRLTWNTGLSFSPSIVADSGTGIHVAWYDDTPGNEEIFYKRSTNSGTSWLGLKRMSWNTGWASPPSLAVDSGTIIHLVWADHTPGNYEIFLKRSNDGGAIWSGLKRMTWNSGSSNGPSIAADSGTGIHLVWADSTPGNEEIFYKRSTDKGVSWAGVKRMTWNTGQSFSSSTTADSGNGIHVVWSDNTPGNYEIYYKRSTDSGASWSGLKRLTWNIGDSFYPSITADSSGGIHVTWHDYSPGNIEIFYKHSTDSGFSWSGNTRLTWNTGESRFPSISADSGNGIHVVWYDDTPGNREIFLKSSTDSGVSWSGLKRITWNQAKSMMPCITTDSGNDIHLVWHDETPGNFEIFYRNRK